METSPNRGFVQLPVVLALVAGLLIVGGTGYAGVKQYQKSKERNAVKIVAPQVQEIGTTSSVPAPDVSARSPESELGTSTEDELASLRKEIESLKRANTAQGPIVKPSLIVAPSPTKPATVQTLQPAIAQPAQHDYRVEIVDVLIKARENYAQVLKYADECASTLARRISGVERLMTPGRETTLASVASDVYLTRTYGLFFDLGDSELYILRSYRTYCENTAALTTLIRGIDERLASIKSSTVPATSDELIAYQAMFFDANGADVPRAAIKNVLDDAAQLMAETNMGYSKALSNIEQYLADVTTPSAPPLQYVPALPPLPQMPQTTRCTISGDGVGLQAYVSCTTSNF